MSHPHTLAALTLTAALTACASQPTQPTQPVQPTQPAQPAPLDPIPELTRLQGAPLAVRPCPGAPSGLTKALGGLTVDQALMEAETGLAEFSHQTREVEGLGALFPTLASQGWRALLVTPLVTRAGQPPELLEVSGVRVEAKLERFEAPEGAQFTAVLGCAASGGYEVLTLSGDAIQDVTLQYFGSDLVPLGEGRVATFTHVMRATPSIMEFGLFSSGWTLAPDTEELVGWSEVDRYGSQVLTFDGSDFNRSDPLIGTGWYPLDGAAGGRWLFVILMGVSGPDGEGGQMEMVTLQPWAVLEP